MQAVFNKMIEIKRTRNTMFNELQENLILQVLLQQYEKQASVSLRGNTRLAALAMIKNKKPKGEMKRIIEAEENQVLNEYIQEL